MSVRSCMILLFAVAALPFLGISESVSVSKDPKFEWDMRPLEEDHTLIVIPVRSGANSFDEQPALNNDSTDMTESEAHKNMAVGHSIKKDPEDRNLKMWSDVRSGAGRVQRGAMKSPKIFSPQEAPIYVGNSKSSCLLPENGLKTAEIRCKLTPTFKTCKSYCIYGYTYEDGIVETSHCNYLENKWSREFEECKPFIDCFLKMIAPGSLKCMTNEVEKPPTCEIECQMYEENDPIPKQNFTCGIDGSWDPYLPHCVEPRGNKVLVYPPADSEHGDILYP